MFHLFHAGFRSIKNDDTKYNDNNDDNEAKEDLGFLQRNYLEIL